MSYITRTSFDGDNNLGLHGFATDKYCFLGAERYVHKVKDALKVKTFTRPLLNMDLVKIFCTGNSSGIVMPKLIRDYDGPVEFPVDTHLIDTKFSSVGNLLLVNDNGIIVSPFIKKHRKELEKFFGLPSDVTTIAGLNVVGTLGFATNKGCLAHPNLKEREKRIIEKTLGVNVDICTVNFGSPYPGAGIVGNSHGFAVSPACSGPELGRMTDVLGFL